MARRLYSDGPAPEPVARVYSPAIARQEWVRLLREHNAEIAALRASILTGGFSARKRATHLSTVAFLEDHLLKGRALAGFALGPVSP